MDHELLSRKIKASRVLANKSQEDIAKELGIGLKTYIKYENNAELLTTKMLFEIAQAVNQDMVYFFTKSWHE